MHHKHDLDEARYGYRPRGAHDAFTWEAVRLGTRRALLATVALCLIASAVPIAAELQADELEDEPIDADIRVELDVREIVRGSRLIGDNVNDPVWEIRPRDGRVLVHVPLIVERPESEVELGRPPISLRGSYFIGWQLEHPLGDRDRGRGRGGRQPARTPARGGSGGPPEWMMDRSWDNPQFPGAGADMGPAVTAGDFHLPDGAPRITRRITISPDGRVTWGIDRTIIDGEVRRGTDAWLIKVRPDRIREMMPEPPNDRRDRAAVERYRREQRAALDRRREANDLPDTFYVPLPERLWAVFGVTDRRDEIGFTGEADGLPWSIARDDLQMLRGFATRRARDRGPLSDDALADVRRMVRLAGDGHPLTHRSIAYALNEAEATARMQMNDPLHRLAHQLIAGPDETARQRVLRDLATADPATPATVAVLRDAAGRMDAQTRVIALRGMIRAAPDDIQQQREMFQIANQLLADPSGPPPDQVLAELARHIRSNSDLMVGAIHAIEFGYLSGDRLDHAIAFVIREAGNHTLAANWLSHRLLGAANPQLVRRTLELLNRTDTGPTAMTPVVDAMFDLVFQRRETGADVPDDERVLDLSVRALAPLGSDDHSLFRSLNSGDPEIYALAWGALPTFQIPTRDDADSERQQRERDRHDMVLRAALSRDVVPVEVVTFLDRQPNDRLATRGLVRIALDADEAASADAVRSLYNSRRPIGDALLALGRWQRAQFAALVYRTLTDDVPVTVALLRQPGSEPRVVEWFGRRIGSGRLPSDAAWFDAYDDEDALLELTVNALGGDDPDTELAQAAVTALAAAAGATPEAREALAYRLTADPRSLSELREAWISAKREIHAYRLAQAAGDYRLTVIEPIAPGATQRPEPIVLGVTELVVEQESAYLGRNQTVTLTIPTDRFAIRIDEPNDLKNFPNPQIADLPLRDIDGSLDLLRQPDGSWRGEAEMGTRGTVRVRLDPVR